VELAEAGGIDAMIRVIAIAAAGALAAAACRARPDTGAARSGNSAAAGETSGGTSGAQVATAPPRDCAPDNGGLRLPDGFCAAIFADSLGHARHLAVAPNGVVYVNTWSGKYYGDDKPPAGGFLIALQDTTGDGRADRVVRFGDSVQSGGAGGTGIAVYHGALYAEANDRIVRYTLRPGSLAPAGPPATIVQGLPLTGDHPMHPFAIDSSGWLYVDLGSATNACQEKNRVPGSPGRKPCTELTTRGGIWRYRADSTGQRFSPAERFATGIRNADGIAASLDGKRVYATQHGRDQLAENWPKLYTQPQGASQPAEELLELEHGADYGWPECYFDSTQHKLVLAPEYGGDGGKAVGPCASKREPIAYFPAHWAPLSLTFYGGTELPERYRGGAFIAFHGSWNRAPEPQEGYNVVFVPFKDGKPVAPGKYEVFADGFAGGQKGPGTAAHRPTGVAVGPGGALYMSEDVRGRIWRVVYRGSAAFAARTQPAGAQRAETLESGTRPAEPPEGMNPNAGANPGGAASLPPPPAPRGSGITAGMVALGDSIFHGAAAGGTCAGCHGPDAKGTPLGPNLTDDQWLWGDGSLRAIQRTIHRGVPQPKQHTAAMPPMGGATLDLRQLHAVASYVYALSCEAGARTDSARAPTAGASPRSGGPHRGPHGGGCRARGARR
jgi:glucose/arabinose dehydrogenase/mono/diheme cytochrome c family protein